jgi:alkylated DNA repair dioxygenase AlkB
MFDQIDIPMQLHFGTTTTETTTTTHAIAGQRLQAEQPQIQTQAPPQQTQQASMPQNLTNVIQNLTNTIQTLTQYHEEQQLQTQRLQKEIQELKERLKDTEQKYNEETNQRKEFEQIVRDVRSRSWIEWREYKFTEEQRQRAVGDNLFKMYSLAGNNIQLGIISRAARSLTETVTNTQEKHYWMWPGLGVQEQEKMEKYTFPGRAVPFSQADENVQRMYDLMLEATRKEYPMVSESTLQRSFLVAVAYNKGAGVGAHSDDDYRPCLSFPVIASVSIGGKANFHISFKRNDPMVVQITAGDLIFFDRKLRHQAEPCEDIRVNFTLRFLDKYIPTQKIFGGKWN